MSKQTDLFSYQKRAEELSLKKSPLDKLNIIDWEIFRPILSRVVNKKKGQAGRTPYDVVLKFKILVLQRLYDLSDEQAEYQIKDRFSFMRFLGLDIHDSVPDENTIRVFREQLIKHKLIEPLFEKFKQVLEDHHLFSRKGVMIDASIVEVPVQRNTKEENKHIKETGEAPDDWKEKPNKLAQKDIDARWTKKNQKSFFGYKNHVRADTKSKLIESYTLSPANVHDSQKAKELLTDVPSGIPVYADSAYSTPEILSCLDEKGLKNKIHEKGARNRRLTSKQKNRNKSLSRVRVRVEHIFGDIQLFGGDFLRNIGLDRIAFQIGLTNLTYNLRRYCVLVG